MTHTAQPERDVEQGRLRRGAMPAIMVSLAAVVSAVSSLNLAAPSIARDLHATQTQIAWVVDSYALVFAALLLLAGAIGDRYGRRRALAAGLVVFCLGALLALVVDTPEQLIAVQGVLGVGAALVMPATLSTITSAFPPERKVRAVGTWAGVSGASAMLGLLAAGLLLETWSWRSVFVFNLVMGVLALLGTLVAVPESADPSAPRLDLVGAALSVVGLGVLVYSIIEAPTEGWGSARTIGGLAAGVVVLAGFLGWEAHTAEPLLDPRLFRLPGFAAGTLTVTLQFFGFFGFIFLIVQYLQLVLGDSSLVAAVKVLPIAFVMMPAARVLAPRAAANGGLGPVVLGGLLLVAAGFAVLAQLDAESSYGLMLAGLLLLGAGMGLAMTPATSAITDALPQAKQGVGSAVNDLSRELGAAVGIAVLGSIMQSVYRDHLHLTGLPAQVAEQARSSLGMATHLTPAVADQARAAFTDGMHASLLWAAGLLVLTTVGVRALLVARSASVADSSSTDSHHGGGPGTARSQGRRGRRLRRRGRRVTGVSPDAVTARDTAEALRAECRCPGRAAPVSSLAFVTDGGGETRVRKARTGCSLAPSPLVGEFVPLSCSSERSGAPAHALRERRLP